MVGDLALYAFDQARPDGVRRDEQAVVLGVHRVPGQLIEQVRHILAHLVIHGQKAEVLVQPSGLRVVVAGPQVAVATQTVPVVAHDHRQLAVRLQSDQAVHHMHAGALQLARPLDVRALVEAGFDLHERQHLLARLRGIDEGVDDR